MNIDYALPLETRCQTCSMVLDKHRCCKPNSLNPKSKVFVISLMVTDECNLNCEHCWFYHAGIRKGKITKQFADDVVAYFKKHHPDHSLVFAFLGGEPTLCLDEVIYLIKAVDKYQEGRHVFRFYTNGLTNISPLVDLFEDYPNILFTISNNYDIVNDYPEYKQHFPSANIVVTEKSDFNKVYDTVCHIKDLGYHDCYIAFDTRDIPFIDKNTYIQNCQILLKRLAPINDFENFVIKNFVPGNAEQFETTFKDKLTSIDLYPDGKFYLTHFDDSLSIGSVYDDIPISFDEIDNYKIVCPCTSCSKKQLCDTLPPSHFLTKGNEIKTNEHMCIALMVNGLATNYYLDEKYEEFFNNKLWKMGL